MLKVELSIMCGHMHNNVARIMLKICGEHPEY